MPKFIRQQRLVTQKQYAHVFNKGKRIVTQGLTLLYCRNQLDYSRVGCAVSKKTLAKAVKRNGVKRVIRESFRQCSLMVPVDIVAISRRGIDKCSKHTIRQELDKVWGKLNKLNTPNT